MRKAQNPQIVCKILKPMKTTELALAALTMVTSMRPVIRSLQTNEIA